MSFCSQKMSFLLCDQLISQFSLYKIRESKIQEDTLNIQQVTQSKQTLT